VAEGDLRAAILFGAAADVFSGQGRPGVPQRAEA
jgi:hypothetical protein